MIVPTLCVGMPQGTLRVPFESWNAERPGLHSHAERGNDQIGVLCRLLLCGGFEAGEQYPLKQILFQPFRVGQLHSFQVFGKR